VLAMVGMVVFSVYEDHQHPMVCTKSEKVDKILALEYRSGVIQLASGKILTVDQATLKLGDDYCLDWERK